MVFVRSAGVAAGSARERSRPGLARRTLVLGGTRSGKSRYAEQLIGDQPAAYVATAESRDAEMAARISAHRARRGGHWTTHEAPLDLAGALATADQTGRPILVECLTLWLSNLLMAGRDPEVERAALLRGVERLASPVVFVANEVGLGIVPDNALARAFRDHAGRLNQDLAAMADRVVFVAAGLPLTLKDTTQ